MKSTSKPTETIRHGIILRPSAASTIKAGDAQIVYLARKKDVTKYDATNGNSTGHASQTKRKQTLSLAVSGNSLFSVSALSVCAFETLSNIDQATGRAA